MKKDNNIVVLKFGGTSMGSAQTINECISVIKEKIVSNKKPFVVVSAISKMTDGLIEMLKLAKENKKFIDIFNDFKNRHIKVINDFSSDDELKNKYIDIVDKKFSTLNDILKGISLTKDYTKKMYAEILSFGEDLSSELITFGCLCNEINATKVHSKNLVRTDGDFLSADVDFKKTKSNFQKLELDSSVMIMTGFFGGNLKNEIMLLGRGGSDYSASIAAVSLDAEVVEIWTDVDGIMSSDPRIIDKPVLWDKLDIYTASEMARAGAKVLHPKTIYASFFDIDILIKNLFNKKSKGTLVTKCENDFNVKGVVSDKDYVIIDLKNQDMYGNTGFISKISNITTEKNVPIDVCTTSEISFSFTIKKENYSSDLVNIFKEIALVEVVENVSKISIIGHNLIKNSKILEKIFSTLGNKNISPLMISVSYSNDNITLIVDDKDRSNTLIALHEILFNRLPAK